MFDFFTDMKIANQNNNVNFKSVPLYNLTLTRGRETVPAVFSKLEPQNPIDLEAVMKIKDNWESSMATLWFCPKFIEDSHPSDFSLPSQYNCIEVVGKEALDKRILCLTENFLHSFGNIKTNFLNTIVTKKEFQRGNDKRQMQNIGSLMLGGFFKDSKRKNVTKIKIDSVNNGFYINVFEKAGINFDMEGDTFIISNDEFDKYLDYCKRELNTNFNEGSA